MDWKQMWTTQFVVRLLSVQMEKDEEVTLHIFDKPYKFGWEYAIIMIIFCLK